MSVEVVNSLVARCSSLEDIIRQQEQTLSALLLRLRDVEQRVSTDERAYEATQQQVTAMIADRNSVMTQFDRVNAALTNQSDRVGALEAAYQGTQSALQGIDQKYDAVVRGIENKVQGDIGGCYQRIQASDQANGEAIRALQTAHQGHIVSLQTVDNNARASLESHQQQVSTDLAAARQRTEALESGMRQALQDVHGGLSSDIKTASAQMDANLRTAVQNHNDALMTLDQRVRGEMLQLNTQEQSDMNALRSRTEELEGNLRSSIVSSHNRLTSDVGSVAQQLQALESRQRAAHQDLIQELSKHDGQMETIDVNWRASVLDLNSKLEGEVNGLQGQINAGAQAVMTQFNAQQSNFANVAEQINRTMSELARTIQDRCILPLENANTNAARQSERINRLTDEAESMREYMRTFAQEVDRTTSQFRQIIEAAVRASHSDLLERINTVAAAAALRADPDEVYAQINTALTKIWGDVSATYTTQRDLNEIQGQIAMLETAVRTEILSLVQKNNEVLGKLDEVQLSPRAAAAAANQQRLASKRVSEVNSSTGDRTPSAAMHSVTEVPRDEAPMPIVHEPEMDAEELRALSDEATKSAQAAEEAERRCVASLNETKSLLETVLRLQATIEQQKEELAQISAAAPQHAARTADAVVAAPPLSKELLASSANAAGGFPSSPSSSDIRRVSGLVNKQDFIVRRSSADGNTRGSPATLSRDIAVDGDSKPNSPSEILLPTHQFLRKKEFNTFKDYVGHEIEGIWAEMVKLRRSGGVPREEVQLLNAQNKQDIVQTVLSTMSNQERDLVYALRTIQVELNAALKNLNAPSQIDVIQKDGFTNFDALRDALISGASSASPKLADRDLQPSAEALPHEGTKGEGKPPRRPSKPQLPRTLRPLTEPLTPRDEVTNTPLDMPDKEESSAVSSGRAEQPLHAELVHPVHRRHSLDRNDVTESPRTFVERTTEGPARLQAGVSARPPLRSNEEAIFGTAQHVPPASQSGGAETRRQPVKGPYHQILASSFDISSTSDLDRGKGRGIEEPQWDRPPPLQQEEANVHLEHGGAMRAPLYEQADRMREPSPLYREAPLPLPPLRAQDYSDPRQAPQHPLGSDDDGAPRAPSLEPLLAEDFSFSSPHVPVPLPAVPLRAHAYDEPRYTAPPPLQATEYSEPRRQESQRPLHAEDYSEPRHQDTQRPLRADDRKEPIRAEDFSFSSPHIPVPPPAVPLRAHAYDEPRYTAPPPLRATEYSEPRRQESRRPLRAEDRSEPTPPPLKPIRAEEYNEAYMPPPQTRRAEEFSFSDSRLPAPLQGQDAPLAPPPLRAQEAEDPRRHLSLSVSSTAPPPLRGVESSPPYNPPPPGNIPFIENSPSFSSDMRPPHAYNEATTADLLNEIAALEQQINMLNRQPAAVPVAIPIPRAPSSTLAPYNAQVIRVNPTAQAYHLIPLTSAPTPVMPYRVTPMEIVPEDHHKAERRRSADVPKAKGIPAANSFAPPPQQVLRIEDRMAPSSNPVSYPYQPRTQYQPPPQPYQVEAPKPYAQSPRTTTPPSANNFTSSVHPAQPVRPKSTPLPPVRSQPTRNEGMTSDPESRRPQTTDVPYLTHTPRAQSGPVRVLGDHMYQGPTESGPNTGRMSSISTSGARLEPVRQKEGPVRFHLYDISNQ